MKQTICVLVLCAPLAFSTSRALAAEDTPEVLPVRVVPKLSWMAPNCERAPQVVDDAGRFGATVRTWSSIPNVIIVDLKHKQPAWVIQSRSASAFAFSRDGRWLASCGAGSGFLLDLQCDRLAYCGWLDGDALGFAPDDKSIGIAAGRYQRLVSDPAHRPPEPEVLIRNLDGRLVESYPLAMNMPRKLSFSNDGTTLTVEGYIGQNLESHIGGTILPATQTIDLKTNKSAFAMAEVKHGFGPPPFPPDPRFPKPDEKKTFGQTLARVLLDDARRTLVITGTGMPEGGVVKAWRDMAEPAAPLTLGTGNATKPICVLANGFLLASRWHRLADLPEDWDREVLRPRGGYSDVELLTLIELQTGKATPLLENAVQWEAAVPSPDGRRLAIPTIRNSERQLELWDVTTEGIKRVCNIPGVYREPNRIDWAGDGKTLGILSPDGTVELLTSGGERVKSFAVPTEGRGMSGLSLSPDGRHIAVGVYGDSKKDHNDAYVLVFDSGTGKEVARFTGFRGWGLGRFVDNNRLLVWGSWPRSPIRLCALTDGKTLWEAEARGDVQEIVYAPGSPFVICKYSWSADVFALADGKRLRDTPDARRTQWNKPATICGGQAIIDSEYGTNIIGLYNLRGDCSLPVASFAAFAGSEWMVWTPDGFWTGSENALDWVAFYRGKGPLTREEALGLNQPDAVRARVKRLFATTDATGP